MWSVSLPDLPGLFICPINLEVSQQKKNAEQNEKVKAAHSLQFQQKCIEMTRVQTPNNRVTLSSSSKTKKQHVNLLKKWFESRNLFRLRLKLLM